MESPRLTGESWATSRRLLAPRLGFGWLLSLFRMPLPLPHWEARGMTPLCLRTQHLSAHVAAGTPFRLLVSVSSVTDGPRAEAHQETHAPDTFALGGSAVPGMLPPRSMTCSQQANSRSI